MKQISKNNSQIINELWDRGVLTWKLHKGQLIVYNIIRKLPKDIREAVMLVSRRWGKSFLGVIMALEDCLQNPGIQVIITGPDIKQTKRIITPIINKIIQDAPAGLIKPTKSEDLWRVGDSVLLMCGFDSAIESVRGLDAYSMYIEETGSSDPIQYSYTMKSVLKPTTMLSRGRTLHLTTPPKEENHPFIIETLPLAELNNALMVFTIEDNPLLSKEEIEQEIKEAGGRGSEHCERELFCNIVKDVKRLLTPEFEESRHVKEIKIPDYTFFMTSIDFGGSKDFHCLLLGYYDFERNKVCYVDEEWLNPNTGTDLVIKAGIEMEKRNNVKWLKGLPNRIIDAQPQTLIDIKRLGYVSSAPQKGKDSVEDGVQAIRVALQKNQIEISPKCKILCQTLKYGMWDKNREDFQRTDALGHCDAMAAMSYHFRHIDRHNNPIPPSLGLKRDTHYFEKTKSDNESALEQAFYEN